MSATPRSYAREENLDLAELDSPASLLRIRRLRAILRDGSGTPKERVREFYRRWPVEIACMRREAGLTPVPIGGSVDRGRRLGYFEIPLRDGTKGYFQRRLDDCLQAALATCLQIPPQRIPDLHLAELKASGKSSEEIGRVVGEQMEQWEQRAGVGIEEHSSLPTWAPRWIGVTGNHCVVMAGRRCLFWSSTWPITLPGGDMEYGITINNRR